MVEDKDEYPFKLLTLGYVMLNMRKIGSNQLYEM